MNELKDCSHKFLHRKGEKQSKTRPVRIAILDTGAHIPSEKVVNVYDDRVIECRTWLRSTEDKGESLKGPCSDRDGHGTHGTGVLLEATQYTNVEVYVAQIFDKRTEKVKQDSIVEDQSVRRIANVSSHPSCAT